MRVSRYRKKIITSAVGWCFAFIFLICSVIYVKVICSKSIDLVMYFGGSRICSVDDRMAVDEALVMLDALYTDSGISKPKNSEVTYRYSLSSGSSIMNADEIADKIYSLSAGTWSRAYLISVDGTDIAACSTYAEAEEVKNRFIDTLISRISESSPGNGRIELTTDISVHSGFCVSGKILKVNDICRNFLNTADEESVCTEISDSRISAYSSPVISNSEKNSTYGFIKSNISGSPSSDKFEINIDGISSSITYRRVITELYTEIVSAGVRYVESPKVFTGSTDVLYEGENGIAENTYEIIYENGVEVSKNLVASSVLSSPKTRVILIGTKPYPDPVPTGKFSWPIKSAFVISSYYSEKRGKVDRGIGHHLGIDIAGYKIKVGEPVYAADGGTVIFAGKLGTYGNLIRIQHESGVETFYAHLDSFNVQAGDPVYKGKKIGEVGMTGQTNGPHLHFEVRIDGATADPLQYLPKLK